MSRFRWLFFAVPLAGLLVGYSLLRRSDGALPVWFGGEKPIPVRVERVRLVSLSSLAWASAELRAVKEVDVVSRVAGKVTDVRYQVGDSVSAGALVATVYSKELLDRVALLEAALSAAQADLREKENQQQAADQQFEKTRELRQRDLIAGRELDQAQSAAETASAQADLARARVAQHGAVLEQSRALLRLTRLSAPMTGVVTRRLREPGAPVAESGAIITIANLDELKVVLEKPSDDLSHLREGVTVKLRGQAMAGKIFEGKVVHLDSTIAGRPSIARAEIRLPNVGRNLQPGMTVEVSLVSDPSQNALLIASSAVGDLAGKSFVYKVVGGRALQQPVTLGYKRAGSVAVVQGLSEGDLVVTEKAGALKPNSKVGAIETEKPARTIN
jgi:membrane fusion protein (multidrug efflux system)